MNFITIALLICVAGASGKYHCFEKGSKNLRVVELVSKKDIQYLKCNSEEKSCDLTEWDGCMYKMKDETVFSGNTCQ